MNEFDVLNHPQATQSSESPVPLTTTHQLIRLRRSFRPHFARYIHPRAQRPRRANPAGELALIFAGNCGKLAHKLS